MPKPCPNSKCHGTLRSKGKGRSRCCSVCGKSEGTRKIGRPPIGDLAMTQFDRNDRRSGSTPRQVKFAMFDPTLAPPWGTGFIYREALVRVVIARSRQRAEFDSPGLKAIPIGSLSAKQRRWLAQ